MSKKRRLWKKYVKRKSNRTRKAYNRVAKACKIALKDDELKYERKILTSNNLGKFYRFINNKLSCKNGIAPLLNDSSEYVFDPVEKANLLNSYFGSVFTSDNLILPTIDFSLNDKSSHLDKVIFTQERVSHLIKKLKKSNSAGPDGIPSIFLKKLNLCLSKPISTLFNIIFDINIVPDIWKHAFVVPIFKKGKSGLAENYRPISITCELCKLFERVIKMDLVHYLVVNNVLNSAQLGFLSKFSTCTNLLQSLNDWTLSIRNGAYSRVAYVDFAKAFDSVVIQNYYSNYQILVFLVLYLIF